MTTKGKKYDFRVVQDNDLWTAEIIRRKTSKETVVSKSQAGFSSQADAQEWAETELKIFLHSLAERNRKRSEKRKKTIKS